MSSCAAASAPCWSRSPASKSVAEASNGVEALHYIKKEKPDLLVLDLTMPEMNGLEVVRSVREESPSTDILVLTMHFSEELARECLGFGALAYVLKSDADTELLAAVDHVRHHQPLFHQPTGHDHDRKLRPRPQRPCRKSDPRHHPDAPRSGSGAVARSGKSNKEVAGVLGVSTRTIESHRNHIMQKMKFASFSELVRFAVRHNLVDP